MTTITRFAPLRPYERGGWQCSHTTPTACTSDSVIAAVNETTPAGPWRYGLCAPHAAALGCPADLLPAQPPAIAEAAPAPGEGGGKWVLITANPAGHHEVIGHVYTVKGLAELETLARERGLTIVGTAPLTSKADLAAKR
ncbi:hypothetical protein [Nonomuraea dietziae]|uniref:hypothetical protein n=1 Tax=Nonomuraea dietziae TaxID=65515 RepID=UPI0033D31261